MRAIRRTLTAICLAAALAPAAPAEGGVWQDIYAEYHDSVVLVQVGFRLADGPVDRPDLLDRLAEEWGFDLRGGFLPFQAGSGFVVTNGGHVVTNHHVVDAPPIDDARTFLSDVLRAAITEFGPDAGLDLTERERVYLDVRQLVERGEMVTRVESAAGAGAAATRILDDTEHDLSVLQIDEPLPVEPMPLALDGSPRVADEVAAIGYPYEEILTIVFEDVVPTFSPGVITALRPNDEVVQHSASLSPGNSGGPLLDRNGLVVGVNVARILDGEALQFAVPVEALLELFGRPGLTRLRDELEERTKRRGRYYPAGPDGTVTLGPTIELATVAGLEVELNGEAVGRTPLTLTGLDEGVYELVLFDEHGQHRRFIRVVPWADASIYRPRLAPFSGTLEVETDPPGARVTVDGRPVGTAPLSIENVRTGTYEIGVSLEGRFARDVTADVRRDATTSVSVEMERATAVELTGLGSATPVSFASQGRLVNAVSNGPVELPDGEWTAVVNDERYREEPVVFSVPEQTTVDFSHLERIGELRLTGLSPAATVRVNGERVYFSGEELVMRIPSGETSVSAMRAYHEPFSRTVSVPDGETVEVAIVLEPTDAYTRRMNRRRGWIALLGGAAVTGGGLWLNGDFIAQPASPTYGVYVAWKLTTLAITGGGAIWGFGGLFTILAN